MRNVLVKNHLLCLKLILEGVPKDAAATTAAMKFGVYK